MSPEPRSYAALIEIAAQIHAEEVNAPAVLALIVDRARELLATDVAWVALVEADRVRVQLAAGATTPGIARMEVELGTGIGGIALREGRTVVVGDQSLYGNGMPAAVHRSLEEEGVVSVMCAPMFRDGEMVGALYVGNRRATDYDDAAVALLTALAGQAAIAIVNSRLYQALTDQNQMLERSFAAHRHLSAASLAGAGPEAIPDELARLIGREVCVTRGDADDGVPIVAGGERLLRELLGPLAAHPALFETLRAYIQAGGHHPTAAEACHIHPSTLKYRLARISEVLGRELREPETRFELGLGLAVHEMLLTRGIDALS